MSAVATYEAIAPVYDAYTSHYDQEGWIEDLLLALEKRGLGKKGSLLDVGCGTGRSFLTMLDQGWEVTACDVSPAMVALAAGKAGDSAHLEVADMRELPVLGEFDLVWSLDDAVNYMLERDELEAALKGMRDNLATDGLLLFDTNALPMYRTFFAETALVAGLEDGRELTWRGDTPKDTEPGSICEATMLMDGEPFATHRQRHFPEQVVLAALERAGLECLDVYGQSTDGIPRKPLDEAAHTKAIFIARAG
jgi:SAM-dependent methyltransferase